MSYTFPLNHYIVAWCSIIDVNYNISSTDFDSNGNPCDYIDEHGISIHYHWKRAFSFMRNEIIKKGQTLSGEDVPTSELISSFNNTTLNESDFNSILKDVDMKSEVFRQFQKALLKFA